MWTQLPNRHVEAAADQGDRLLWAAAMGCRPDDLQVEVAHVTPTGPNSPVTGGAVKKNAVDIEKDGPPPARSPGRAADCRHVRLASAVHPYSLTRTSTSLRPAAFSLASRVDGSMGWYVSPS